MSEPSAVQATATISPARPHSYRTMLQTIMAFIWFAGSLFLGAGRLDWIRGWISVGLSVVGMTVVGLIVRHYNSGLLEERAKWRRKDTKLFDKIFLAVYIPLILIQPAVAGLDAGRYHWASMPFSLVYVGSLLFVVALTVITWAMVVNPFAESSVRIQNDRGHRVITSGPYRFVRHPMYVGMILMYLANPLIWGSVAALLITAITTPLLVWRTSGEDRTLSLELTGYPEYTARTRYRLVPGLW
jgi:protein-S-isoprenylcysteine O-methyltransferase Ste14